MVDSAPAVGLRERKKAKTKDAIQSHAARLFRTQGYDGTTVEQIAEAAEVSPSTFFRYFATKEAVVLDSEYDELLAESIRRQPLDVSVFEAVRRAMRELQESDTTAARATRERNRLILSVPDLRAAWIDRSISGFLVLIGESLATRVGRDPKDFEVRMLAGALHGVWLSAMFAWSDRPRQDFNDLVNDATELLEDGFFTDKASNSRKRSAAEK